jgi:pimeloyl-ACP methyl ester carboxylesterase
MSNAHRTVAALPPKTQRDHERFATLTVDGRAIAYHDVGNGPTIILAHCSGASHKAWAPLVTVLHDRYRVLAPDLLGYGRSEPWPVNARLHPWSDLGALLALAELAGEPVHLGGHSYGGTVALEAARLLGARVRSLTLIEPIAFHLLGLTGRTRESQEITDVGRRMTEALRRRRDREAAGVYMKYWAGRLSWWAMSPKARRRVVDTVGKVGAEFETVAQLSTTTGDYRSIHTPTRLIVGERTPQPARAIVDDLLDILPNAHVRELAGAGHMSPLTHPALVARLVAEHIDGVEGRFGQEAAASA